MKYGEYDHFLGSFKKLDDRSMARLYLAHKGADYGLILLPSQGQDRAQTLSLKTKLIRQGHSVTLMNGAYLKNYGTPSQSEEQAQAFLVYDQGRRGTLKQGLITLAQEYGLPFAAFFDQKSQSFLLIGTGSEGYPGSDHETVLAGSLFDENGKMVKTVPGLPFVFEGPAQGFHNFNCSKSSYNMSVIMLLLHCEEYVLSE